MSEEGGATRKARRRWSRALAVLVLCATLVAVGIGALIGRPVAAPDWLADCIEARIANLVPGATLGFDDLYLLVGRQGRVAVTLSDARLTGPDGTPVAEAAELEIAAATRPLLTGRVELRRARLSGAILALSREQDGRLGIGLAPTEGRAPTVPETVEAIDAALSDPRLSGLRTVALDGVSVRYTDARAGREWLADGGRIEVTRQGDRLALDGAVTVLGAGAEPARLQMDAESTLGTAELSFGLSVSDLPARDIATQSPALAWLDGLRAPISGAFRGWTERDGSLGGLDVTLRIGAGALQPTEAATPIAFEGARTYFSFDPSEGRIDFSEIAVDSAQGTARASGRAVLEPARGDAAPAIAGQFVLTGVEANPGGLFPEPLDLERVEVDVRLSRAPFRVEIGRLRVADPEAALTATGGATATGEGWDVRFDAEAEDLSVAQVVAHWPLPVAPGTRDWVAERVLSGTAREAIFSFRRAPGADPELYVDADLAGASVLFADTFPPVEGGAGRLVIDRDRLSVRLEAGTLTPPQGGPVDLSGSAFVIPDTRAKPATGDLRLSAHGSATAALSVVNLPPMSVLDRAGRPVDLAEGQVEVTGRIERPLEDGVGFDETVIDLSGTVRDVESDSVVPGRRLAAEALSLEVTNERVAISGPGTLSGVAFDGGWTLPLGEGAGGSSVEGTAQIGPDAADAFGIALPDGLISGRGPARIALDLPPDGAAPRFRLTSDLAGIGMSIPQVGWSLARGTTGQMEVAGRLGNSPRVDTLSLNAGGLRTTGAVSLRADGGLDRVRLDRVRIGDWLDAPVTLTGRGAGAAPAVAIGGGMLDLRGATLGGEAGGAGGSGGGVPLDVQLDRLTISEGIRIEGLAGRFTTAGSGLDGGFTARMAGTGAPLTGQLLPQNGGTGLRLLSEDAGDVLESTGILRTVASGRMVLNLTPTGAPGTYDGAVTITDARLRDAPAIGSILDAVSIVGIIDQLEGPGIYFQDVEARFRLSPERVVVTESSAVGPSIGVSLDGYVDLASGALDLQGVLSPVYVINSIGSIFTRRGEGLLGFNFNIRGTSTAPEVAVNPLSVFTPGMFRELFRRPPPTTR
ncbi:Protein of unknown function [Roseivivax marinus]|uniref:YhdP family protein n=1 Tax=Roseivivax marinus TaxID=1379903 RepID=UPI0008B9A705|nr:AsmA-like C-terminal region-containing protein [Roseivivax marinus]SEL07712.1 Protein of unknown function [Roseivivax marinus]